MASKSSNRVRPGKGQGFVQPQVGAENILPLFVGQGLRLVLGKFEGQPCQPVLSGQITLPYLIQCFPGWLCQKSFNQFVIEADKRLCATGIALPRRCAQTAAGRPGPIRAVLSLSHEGHPRPRHTPPNLMSVPRPAMLVAMVICPRSPASATISASSLSRVALRIFASKPRSGQPLPQPLAGLYASGAHQNGRPVVVQRLDFGRNRLPFGRPRSRKNRSGHLLPDAGRFGGMEITGRP